MLEDNLRCHSLGDIHLTFERGSLTENWSSPIGLGWLGNKRVLGVAWSGELCSWVCTWGWRLRLTSSVISELVATLFCETGSLTGIWGLTIWLGLLATGILLPLPIQWWAYVHAITPAFTWVLGIKFSSSSYMTTPNNRTISSGMTCFLNTEIYCFLQS